MKDALKHDRARIQVGRISHFGLLEMSRQRIRTSVLESSTEKCPVCGGTGHVRSVSSVALQLLRAIEEMLNKGATHNLIVRTRSEVALYVLNHKRAHLRALEERFRITITISADATVNAPGVLHRRSRRAGAHGGSRQGAGAAAQPPMTSALEADEDVLDAAAEDEADEDDEAEAEAEATRRSRPKAPDLDASRRQPAANAPRGDGERDGGRRRRRRGRGRGRGGEPREPREGAPQFTHETVPEHAIAHEDHDAGSPEEVGLDEQQPRPGRRTGRRREGGEVRRRRRRGRRGGRRNRQAATARRRSKPTAASAGTEHCSTRSSDLDQPPRDVRSRPMSAGHGTPIIDRPYNEPPSPPEPRRLRRRKPPRRAAEPEPPRRRSTIREPAPIGSCGRAAAAGADHCRRRRR